MKKRVEYQVCTASGATIDCNYYKSLVSAKKAARSFIKRNEDWAPRTFPLVIWKLEALCEVVE